MVNKIGPPQAKVGLLASFEIEKGGGGGGTTSFYFAIS